ncbi:MAG: FAD-dependent oxidoreductase [Burkholderiaceae bacterium]|nr:FAD-dependent oxidoreductase [Burkholderiaceae bacterium]MDP1968998.1 FAD-dependent oxidoreductase [Burkholderiaceae bacterium]
MSSGMAPSAHSYAHALAPIQVGRTRLRNRIFVPAHTTAFGSHHLPTERHLHYHAARARGGVAAIIFEGIRVHENCLGRPSGVGGYDRACIAPFRDIVAAVQQEGAKLWGQVLHLGRQIDGDFERTVSWGPSAVRWSGTSAMPHAMNLRDMQEVIDGHVVTCGHLLEAGLDGLEIHLGHGHLLQQYLSPSSNQRRDAFGGSLENRSRFPLQVLKAVRAAVGPDTTLGIRISAEEFIADGLHLDEMCELVPRLVKEIGLDFVNVSHSAYHASYSLATQMADMAFDPALFRPLPQAIRDSLRRQGLSTPVMAVCRFRSLQEAETAIAEGQADMVGMARAHIADPAIVRKAIEGREDETRPCIGCNQGCAGMLEKNIPIRCLMSPSTGLEASWSDPPQPSGASRRVLVVGGGPAGMQAAWVAAARGHAVTLWEQGPRLGGQINALRSLPARSEFLKLLDYQERQLQRHGVQVALSCKADVQDIIGHGADVLILATGSTPVLPAIPGATGLEDAIGAPDRLGLCVAFADLTGEWSALASIEHLLDLGKAVTVFVPFAAFSWRTTIYSTLATTQRLREKGVRIRLLRRVTAFSQGVLTVEDSSSGTMETHEGFSALVVAQHNVANDGLYQALIDAGQDVRMAGDVLAPRTALEAVFEAEQLARRI